MGERVCVLLFIIRLLLTEPRAALARHAFSSSLQTTDMTSMVTVTRDAYNGEEVNVQDRTDSQGASTDGYSRLHSSTHTTKSGRDAVEMSGKGIELEHFTNSTRSELDTSEGNATGTDNSIVDGASRKNRSCMVTTDVTLQYEDTTNSQETGSTSSEYEVLGPVGYATLNLVLSWAGLWIALLGTVLNSMAVVVLGKMSASATNSYMTGLTVLDILYLLMTLVPFIFNLVISSATFDNRFYVYYAKYVSSGLMPSLRRTIICVTTMLSLERLIAVALPLRAVKSRLVRNPKTFMVITFIVVIMSNVHSFFRTYITDIFDPRTNITRISMIQTTFYEENETMFVVTGYLLSALFVYMPLLTIVICNIWLVVALHRHSSARSSYKTEGKPRQFFVLERQTAILILTYTVLFVLLALPYSLHGVVQGLVPAFSMHGAQVYLYIGMQRLYGFLDVLSSSMNFPVYLARSSDFRLHLRAVLRLRAWGQRTTPVSIRSTSNASRG